MASSLAIMGMMRGAQAGLAVGDAYKAQVNAKTQAANIDMQMGEMDLRSDIAIKDIFKQSERVQASQVGAFSKAGVKLEGSAMDVISDTISDAAEAAMITKRQSDYDLIGLAAQKASFEEQASNINLLLNSATGAMSAYTGYMSDKRNYNKGSSSAASGIA